MKVLLIFVPNTVSITPVQDEWLDTETEEKFGRLRWLASDDSVTPSARDAAPPDLEEVGPSGPVPSGNKAIGCRIGIWWIDDAQFYYGAVRQYDTETGALLTQQGCMPLFQVSGQYSICEWAVYLSVDFCLSWQFNLNAKSSRKAGRLDIY